MGQLILWQLCLQRIRRQDHIVKFSFQRSDLNRSVAALCDLLHHRIHQCAHIRCIRTSRGSPSGHQAGGMVGKGVHIWRKIPIQQIDRLAESAVVIIRRGIPGILRAGRQRDLGKLRMLHRVHHEEVELIRQPLVQTVDRTESQLVLDIVRARVVPPDSDIVAIDLFDGLCIVHGDTFGDHSASCPQHDDAVIDGLREILGVLRQSVS